jgi:ribosomal protein S18 acetylase RimI-like enzyme
MNDRPVEYRRGDFRISTDRAALDLDAALGLLWTTWWARSMKREVLARAMENSVCFGLYHGTGLVGFARVVTDLATYAYWTDVVIAAEYRGRGLGCWLGEAMLAHPELQGLRRVSLLTRDQMPLYAGLGFGTDLGEHVYMEQPGPRGRPAPP